MIKRRPQSIFVGVLCVVILIATPTRGLGAPAPGIPVPGGTSAGGANALAYRQTLTARMMAEIEAACDRVARQLSPTDPRSAWRLRKALLEARATFICNRMKEVAGLLDQDRYAEATAQEQKIVESLQGVLRLLLDDQANHRALAAEIDQVRDYRAKILTLIEAEKGHARASQAAADGLEVKGRRAAHIPLESGGALADAQHKTTSATADLLEQMARDATADGQGWPLPSADAPPGQERVEKALGHMQDAEGDLRTGDPGSAKPKQDQAVVELKGALGDVDDAIEGLAIQLREERQEDLEARFRHILARQQSCSFDTRTLDAAGPPDSWDRARVQKCAQGAAEELNLAALTGEGLLIIQEDGTTTVLPRIVQGLRTDLDAAGGLLGERQAGQTTQKLQQEIERTLVELIDAIKRTRHNAKPPDGDPPDEPPGEPKPPPLVPNSAELKLLRAAQVRVNARTADFERDRPPGHLTPAHRALVQAIADLQRDLRDLAAALATQL